MKSTGMIRRIDELGRIVIPKEIRKHLNIKDDENLEIFVENNQIILKKYSQITNNLDYIKPIIDIINNIGDFKVFITNNSKFVISPIKLEELTISSFISTKINERQSFEFPTATNFLLTSIDNIEEKIIGKPIIIDSNCIGMIIITTTQNYDIIKYISNILKLLIEKQLQL